MKKIIVSGYALFLCTFVFFSYAFVDPNLFYLQNIYSGFHTTHREITAAVFTVFVVLYFVFYSVFLFYAYRKKMHIQQVIMLVCTTCGILIFSYPAVLSYDIFNYITSAKVLFYYHENPYIIMPIEFIGEPYLSFTRAANKVALYGPAWTIISGIPYFLGFGSFILTLFSFKAFVLCFYALTGFILYKLSKNIFTIVLFLLNPLVIIETIVSGHNDIVMVFFILLSFYLLQKKRIFWAITVLLLSIGIKYVTIILLPIFFYAMIKTFQKEKINWDRIFSLSGWGMLGVFLLAPLREEIYPWYVVWFFCFAVLGGRKSFLFTISIVLTFTTLLRYIPVLYTGSYEGVTPIAKEIFTFIPLIVIVCIVISRKFYRKYEV